MSHISCPDCGERIGSIDWSAQVESQAMQVAYAVRKHGFCAALMQHLVSRVVNRPLAALDELKEVSKS